MAEIVSMGKHVLHTEFKFECGDCNGLADGTEDVSLVEGEPMAIFLSINQLHCPHCERAVIIFQVVNEPLELTVKAQTDKKDILH